MMCVLFAGVFDTKIVDAYYELDGSRFVEPKARGVMTLEVPFGAQSFFEEFLCQQSCLRKSVHPTFYCDVDGAIGGCLVAEAIVLDDRFGHVFQFELDIFESGQRGHQVEVLDVHCEELGPRCGDNAV